MQDTSTFFNATKTCLQKKLFLKKALSVASKIENKIKAQSEFWNYFICFIWEELTGNCTLSGLLFTSFMLIGVTYIISFEIPKKIYRCHLWQDFLVYYFFMHYPHTFTYMEQGRKKSICLLSTLLLRAGRTNKTCTQSKEHTD